MASGDYSPREIDRDKAARTLENELCAKSG